MTGSQGVSIGAVGSDGRSIIGSALNGSALNGISAQGGLSVRTRQAAA
ncbi:hypothetical protein [Xanthomonas maliensis]|nr:hypothetical protein [Xanthomonas maliensis]